MIPCVAAGKVTVGLVSHGHASQTVVVLPPYGLMASEREMSTPPIPSRSMAHFTFTLPGQERSLTISLAGFSTINVFDRLIVRHWNEISIAEAVEMIPKSFK